MRERIIIRDHDGRWLVKASVNGPLLSGYERREDALARVTTGLLQAGGGHWVMLDSDGSELDRGQIPAASDISAAAS